MRLRIQDIVLPLTILLSFSFGGDSPLADARSAPSYRLVQDPERVAIASAQREADIVFLGRAVFIIHVDTLTGANPTGATFRVEHTWKGQVGPEVTVLMSQDFPVRFQNQVEYLIYAHKQASTESEEVARIEALPRTADLALASKDIAVLDALAAPRGKSPRIPVILGAGMLLLAIMTIVLLRRRTRRL